MPVAFDVVWCKYPQLQHGQDPGPVARPCLVRKPYTHLTTIKGKEYTVGYVDVIYGTKWVDKFTPPQGFHVDDAAEKKACGLKVDTVFDLLDHEILPWSLTYFSNDNGRPTIGGRFTGAMQTRLKEQVKLLQR
ncbi:hypothetical protein [Rhizobium leguminosarum]|uniref:hypothetical protein n=1 Tax=Rhizobium leguminosarum TaxID=384 RepID=UPI001F2BEB5A|nr:hypothetical protein [Rhizobium leguminosarum]UIJ81811.1 hypothetical protein LZK78_11250 [Rhizobium leguminosarum]